MGTTWMGSLSEMREDYSYHNLFYGTEEECNLIYNLRQRAEGYLSNEEGLVSLILPQERHGRSFSFETVECGFIDGTIDFSDNTSDDFYMRCNSSDEEWSVGWGNGWGKTWRPEEVEND